MSELFWALAAALLGTGAVLLLIPSEVDRTGALRTWALRMRPWRIREQGEPDDAEAALLLDLTAALLAAGVGVEAALERLARAVPGAQPLAGVHRGLAAGVSWEQAAEQVAGQGELEDFCEYLSFAYATGAPSARMLGAAATRARADHRHEAEAAAEKLGVKMMLPLGACFLPAFILLGVVPVVVSMIPDALGL